MVPFRMKEMGTLSPFVSERGIAIGAKDGNFRLGKNYSIHGEFGAEFQSKIDLELRPSTLLNAGLIRSLIP